MNDNWLQENEITENEIPCPVCGQHSYSNYPCMKDGKKVFAKTVLWCMRFYNERRNRCTGKLVFCDKCSKYYSESDFGFRDGAYECKKCGKVQWKLTDCLLNDRNEQEKLNAIRRNMRFNIY